MRTRLRRTLAGSLLVAVAAPVAAHAAAPYVVVVDYTADAAHFEQLKTLVVGVAKASIAEPGCRRFDVVLPAGSPGHLTLYEVFDDQAAFTAHAAMPHFKQFATDSAALGAVRVATPGSLLLTLQKP